MTTLFDETIPPRSVTDILTQKWWTLAWRGAFALLFGLLVFFSPGISLLVLVLLFGGYALADGLFALLSAFAKATDKTSKPKQTLWPMLLQGVVGIAAAVLTFVWPGITALVLLYLIAAWAIITGIFQIVQAIRLRKEIEGEWLLVLGGIASVVFGLLLQIFPGAGALAVVWLIGAYSMVFGILLVFLAFRLRQRSVQEPRGMSPKPT
jgi:uncharacterized membrane protein HdeD (DUF308 family)